MIGTSGNPFEPLEPPPGGLEGLRARIAREPVRAARLRVARGAAAGLAIVALVTAVWISATLRGPTPESHEFRLARVHFGLDPAPGEPVVVPESRRGDTAVRRVPLADDRVVFYRVGFVGEDPDEETGADESAPDEVSPPGGPIREADRG